MVSIPKKNIAVFFSCLLVTAIAAYSASQSYSGTEKEAQLVIAEPNITVGEPEFVSFEKVTEPWSDEELNAMARCLAGECYNDKPEDKRLVCEVILNRVSNGYWGNTVVAVLEYEGQFNSYWKQSRPVSQSDLEIAEKALEDWYANDCEALSDYLYFSAGDNRENEFRVDY